MGVMNEENVTRVKINTLRLNGGSERNCEELGGKAGRASISDEWLKVVD
jgi:hypothetical protein